MFGENAHKGVQRYESLILSTTKNDADENYDANENEIIKRSDCHSVNYCSHE